MNAIEKEQKINELKKKLEILENTKTEEDYIVDYLQKARETYVGKPILINNEESGCFWITNVDRVEWEEDEYLVFYGSGVKYGGVNSNSYHLQERSIHKKVIGVSFYSNPDYHRISDWVKIYDTVDDLKKDMIEHFTSNVMRWTSF